MPEALEKQHLADLHTLAAELGVEGYRKLRRDDLVREIEARGGGEVTEAVEAPEAEAEPSPEAEEGATDEEVADRWPARREGVQFCQVPVGEVASCHAVAQDNVGLAAQESAAGWPG